MSKQLTNCSCSIFYSLSTSWNNSLTKLHVKCFVIPNLEGDKMGSLDFLMFSLSHVLEWMLEGSRKGNNVVSFIFCNWSIKVSLQWMITLAFGRRLVENLQHTSWILVTKQYLDDSMSPFETSKLVLALGHIFVGPVLAWWETIKVANNVYSPKEIDTSIVGPDGNSFITSLV